MTCNACGAKWPEGATACARCGGTEAAPEHRTDSAHTGSPSTMDQATADELLARVKRELGRDYEVHSELGRGGMAVVYKATELEGWKTKIENVASKAKTTYVIANNHFEGKAGVNALELKSMLSGKRVKAPAPLVKAYPELRKFADPVEDSSSNLSLLA